MVVNVPLVVSLKNRYRSVRMARRIADRIGTRFYAYNRHGIREPLASPKTDRTIVLKIHPKYKDNFPRFLRVIRLIAIRGDNVARQVRMQQLAGELESVQTARQAALSLEAMRSPSMKCSTSLMVSRFIRPLPGDRSGG